jgi:hypothetical protein
MQIFTGYKHAAGKGEQYAIGAPNLSELWAKADKVGRIRLVEKMKQQGGFDFVTYEPAQSIQYVVINWLLGKFNNDEYGVTVGEF